jgi:hypothetical protein
MVIRVDGDVIVYRAGFAAEHTYWSMSHAGVKQEFETRREMIAHAESLGLKPGEYVVETRREVEPVENALYNVRSIIRTTAESLQADPRDDVVVYLSGPTNFRNGVATILPYKGNRDKAHKPEHAAEIKAMIRREYNVVTSEDEEADDVMAYEHYASWLRDPYESVIATIDKDLDMIPGLHYNFVTGNSYEITPEQGIYNFYKQCLTGDTTDNIPGIAKVGPVRAAKILEGAGGTGEAHLFGAVRQAYIDSYGDDWAARLLEVGRLLWIRRHPNEWWNFPEGETISDNDNRQGQLRPGDPSDRHPGVVQRGVEDSGGSGC